MNRKSLFYISFFWLLIYFSFFNVAFADESDDSSTEIRAYYVCTGVTFRTYTSHGTANIFFVNIAGEHYGYTTYNDIGFFEYNSHDGFTFGTCPTNIWFNIGKKEVYGSRKADATYKFNINNYLVYDSGYSAIVVSYDSAGVLKIGDQSTSGWSDKNKKDYIESLKKNFSYYVENIPSNNPWDLQEGVTVYRTFVNTVGYTCFSMYAGVCQESGAIYFNSGSEHGVFENAIDIWINNNADKMTTPKTSLSRLKQNYNDVRSNCAIVNSNNFNKIKNSDWNELVDSVSEYKDVLEKEIDNFNDPLELIHNSYGTTGLEGTLKNVGIDRLSASADQKEILLNDAYDYILSEHFSTDALENEVSDVKKCLLNVSEYAKSKNLLDENHQQLLNETIEDLNGMIELLPTIDITSTDYLERLTCTEVLGEDVVSLLKKIFSWIRILVPILIIVLGMLDLSQAVFSNEEGMKKAQKRFVNRLIIGVVIFLIPTFVSLLLDYAAEYLETDDNVGAFSDNLDCDLY